MASWAKCPGAAWVKMGQAADNACANIQPGRSAEQAMRCGPRVVGVVHFFRTTVPHDSLRSRGRRAACESRRGVPCRRCAPRPVAAAAQPGSGVRPDAGRYASQHAWPRWRAPAQITVKSCGLPPLGDRLVPVENCSARVSLPISTSHQVSTWLVVSKDHLPVLVTAAPVLT